MTPSAHTCPAIPSSLVVILSSLAAEAQVTVPAQPGATPWLGDATCAYGASACNRCVPNVPSALAALRTRGDVLGFSMNGSPDVTQLKHWQGIQRLPAAGGQYLAVSRSLPANTEGPMFVIVQLASRPTGGLRLGSNRAVSGCSPDRTAPSASDKIVASVPRQAPFTHAGGMQAVGNVLAVPVESGPGSRVVFFDLSNPLSPTRLPQYIDHVVADTSDGGSNSAGAVAVAKLNNGKYAALVGRSDSNTLDLYLSAGTGLGTSSFAFVRTWKEGDTKTEMANGDHAFGPYQNLNLITECSSGRLYLLGTHRGGSTNWVDLFRVDLSSSTLQITKVANKQVDCTSGNTQQCNLHAAGGAYVSPSGDLILYAVEHDNDGPLPSTNNAPVCRSSPDCSGATCSVKMQEF